ncbi:MAG: peptide deformylase [bacterium]
MAILKVAQMGHPILRARARAVTPAELATPDFKRFLADLVETMREYEGVGLAAPQVHRGVRVAVIEAYRNARYPDAPDVPLRILVNPRVTPLTETRIEWWEGCLSIPGLRGLVRRPRKVRVEALDGTGTPRVFTAEDFLAVVVQHETDHLDGRLFLDRMDDLSELSFQKEYERHHLAHESNAREPGRPSRRGRAGRGARSRSRRPTTFTAEVTP